LLVKEAGEKQEYTIRIQKTAIGYSPPVFSADLVLTVPVRFAGKNVFKLMVPIRVEAWYGEKY
jgi:hypothetical protein